MSSQAQLRVVLPASFLVDGGVTHNSIDEKLVWESGVISFAKESPDIIKLANGCP